LHVGCLDRGFSGFGIVNHRNLWRWKVKKRLLVPSLVFCALVLIGCSGSNPVSASPLGSSALVSYPLEGFFGDIKNEAGEKIIYFDSTINPALVLIQYRYHETGLWYLIDEIEGVSFGISYSLHLAVITDKNSTIRDNWQYRVVLIGGDR
jgi:hypothetical protein